MDDKSVEQIKKMISDFRLLATKVQKDNQTKTKDLKKVLETCRKEYQKLHHENETLKKLLSNKKNCKNVKINSKINVHVQKKLIIKK